MRGHSAFSPKSHTRNPLLRYQYVFAVWDPPISAYAARGMPFYPPRVQVDVWLFGGGLWIAGKRGKRPEGNGNDEEDESYDLDDVIAKEIGMALI